MRGKLEDIVRRTCEEVIRDRSSGVATDDSEYLVGCCVENANILAQRIREETDWDATVIKGAVDYPKEPTPNSYDKAEKDGTLHHWVRVSGEGEVFYCNLIKEGRRIYTQPLVSQSLPSSYIKF